MSNLLRLIAVSGLALSLSACGGSGDKGPDGAPVAKVYGQAITLADLKAEAPNAQTPEARAAVLSEMINRKLFAQAATGKSADAARAAETALSNAKGREIVEALPQPTASEIDQFIAAHPEAFAARKFLIIEQIEVRTPKGAQSPPASTAKTLDELQTQFDAAKVFYQRTLAVVDTASALPATINGLLALPAGMIFSMQNADARVIGRIVEVRDAPFSGPFARQVAGNLVKAEKARAAIAAELEALRTKAGSKIEYMDGYRPPS